MMHIMLKLEHRENLAKALYCSGLLEEEVAKVYHHLATRMPEEDIKCLLEYIANDSLKHAEVLKAISKCLTITGKADFETCEKIWGEIWRKLINDAKRQLLRKGRMNRSELESIIDSLERLENCVGEEYLTILHMKAIELIAQEQGIDLKHYKVILEWIVEDEKRHQQTLDMIKNIITKNSHVKHHRTF